MGDLFAVAVLLMILAGVGYAVYLIPSVKRRVRSFAARRFELIVTLGVGLSGALLLYFVILPRL